ncbi:MAG: acetate kinase, partial [Clostridia bacterium]|nr:acetate kinase [Clostridia bacterium]
MKVLVVNAGSSSLKYQFIETDDSSVLCKGGIERIGTKDFDKPNVSHKGLRGEKEIKVELADHTAAFN